MSEEFVPTQDPEEEGALPEVDIFDGIDEDLLEDLPDPSRVIGIKTQGAETRFVPATEAMSIPALLQAAGLTVSAAVEYWLNGSVVSQNELIPVGQTLVIVGTVKGG